MGRPTIFIGSSSEGLEIARAVEWHLDREVEVTLWSQGVFGLGMGTLEALVASLDQFDFAVLVLTPDDLTESRGQKSNSPRDNVLIELGLFLGSKGRSRTFVLCDRDVDLKIPGDLAGVTLATFAGSRSDRNLRAAVSPACTEIIERIKLLGKSPLREDISTNPAGHQSWSDQYLQDRSAFKPFPEFVRSADKIYLFGPSLIGIFHANSHVIFERVRQGGELRIVLFDPEGRSLGPLAQALGVRPEQLASEIRSVIGLCEEYALGGIGAGNFELLLTEVTPGFSMVVVNPDKLDGKAIIEYIGYQSDLPGRPHLELEADRDRRWFQYYIEQFHRIADTGRAYELPAGKVRQQSR